MQDWPPTLPPAAPLRYRLRSLGFGQTRGPSALVLGNRRGVWDTDSVSRTPRTPGESAPKAVVLEPGRWTIMLPGESPREAEERLTRGEPGAEESLSPETRAALDGMNRTQPRFGRGNN